MISSNSETCDISTMNISKILLKITYSIINHYEMEPSIIMISCNQHEKIIAFTINKKLFVILVIFKNMTKVQDILLNFDKMLNILI